MTISGIHVEEDPERKSRNKIFLSTRFLVKFLSFFHRILSYLARNYFHDTHEIAYANGISYRGK